MVKKIRANLPLYFFLFVFILIVWRLFDTHIIKPGPSGNLTTGESTYGDLPFHLSATTQMAYAPIFPPQNPFFAGVALVYPFFINFISAVLMSFGMSLRDSIIVPGMFFSILMAVGLYIFYKAIVKNNAAGVLGAVLFFLNGGMGFYFFARDVVFKNLLSDFLQNPGRYADYSHVFDQNIQWPNFLSRIIVPERSVLLGIPMGIAILYLLFLRKSQRRIDNSLLAAGILMGLLPLSHTHTFLTFLMVIPLLALFEISRKNLKAWFGRWSVFWIIAFCIALPQLVFIFGRVSEGGSFFRFRLGWMSEAGFFNFLVFWFKNAGILILLTIASLFIKQTPVFLRKLVLCSGVIFVVINLFIFQPYDWDNVKFLFWTGAFCFLAASYVLVFLWQKKGVPGKIVSIFLILCMSLSAIISLYREINLSYQLFSKEEVSLGAWVRANTPTSSVFLTGPIHNSFVNNLAGRRIYMGYPGTLWVHGIDYSQREKDVKEMYAGSYPAERFAGQIDYAVVGPVEKNDLKANIGFFQRNYCLVKRSENYSIFSILDCSKTKVNVPAYSPPVY